MKVVRFARSLSLAVAASLVTYVCGGAAPARADAMVVVPTTQLSSTLLGVGGTVFGDTDPGTQERVSFVLVMRGRAQLADAVERRGGARFEDVLAFARLHGQWEKAAELQRYLRAFGIRTVLMADHLEIRTVGTANEYNRALHVRQVDINLPLASGRVRRAHAPLTAPLLPRALATSVTAVLGLSNYEPFESQLATVDPALKMTARQASVVASCPDSNTSGYDCHLPGDFSSRYGLTRVAPASQAGRGRTIGIVTVAALDIDAPETFWSKYAKVPATAHRRVSVRTISGGPGKPSDISGSGETDADVEQAGGVAPAANIIVYQAPNTDAGWIDAFFSAASDNTADTITSSWGLSETFLKAAAASGGETPAWQAAYDEVFLELAAQGQSTFLASGDHGAYTASADLGTTNLSVNAPASSPFVTATGGTTLPWTAQIDPSIPASRVSVRHERAWGWDYMWAPAAAAFHQSIASTAVELAEGSGGGYSAFERQPVYQEWTQAQYYQAIEQMNPTAVRSFYGLRLPTAWRIDPGARVTHGVSFGRAEPDVSANADPYTGYLLYQPSARRKLQAGGGGTSFVAPQFAAAAAVIDARLGARVGLWNPLLYRVATQWLSPVTPLDTAGASNDNLFYTGTAGAEFNPAVGLGIVDLGGLALRLRAMGIGLGAGHRSR